jgi:Short C-terminal domain
MIGRPMVVRRRPLLRAAAVGGTFAAGRAMGRRAEADANAQTTQDQRISDLEYQQGQQNQMQQNQMQQPQMQPPQEAGAAQAGGGSSVMDQLSQLATLHEQGALNDDEFAAAKAKILGS